MILIYFSMLMLLFLFLFLMLFISFFSCNYMLIFEWLIFSYNGGNFSFMLYMDYISSLFMMTVSLISMIVLFYSIEYMEGEKFLNRFSMLVMLFIMSMFLMIMSPSMLTILLGWDGLGLISYCLIIFYQNSKAYSAGMLTVFSNRIGDVGILMMICLSFKFNSWNLMNYNMDFLMLMLLIIICFTKSAQIPFSLWLPAAMMAPTPVSSLVHSSTLVTAGVYLMIRYNNFLFLYGMNEYIFFVASLTMFMAGFIANYEFDFKKIIALSTLSQLGLMMSILSMGLWELSFFHLIIHALFKSLMFLCVGSYIHYFKNSQDIRSFGGLLYIYPFKCMILILSMICLMGFPFLSGYYSKDLIMEYFFYCKLNKFSLLMMLMSTMFTVSYSIRTILYIIFYKKKYPVLLFIKESLLMNMCMLIMVFMIIFVGMYMYKIMYWDKLLILTKMMKFMVLKLLIYGNFMGVYFYMINCKMNFNGLYFTNMFLMSSLYQMYKNPMNLVKLYEIYYEKVYFEYKIKFIYMMYYMNMNNYKNFNLMMIYMIIMYMIIIFYMMI